MRELTVREISAVKRQFLNSLPALKKVESINEKIKALEAEKAIQVAIIEGGEAGIKAMTGGYMSVDLIHCEYVPQFNEDGTPKMDAEGKYQMRKRVLTFVPPVPVAEAEVTDAAYNPAESAPETVNDLNEAETPEVDGWKA